MGWVWAATENLKSGLDVGGESMIRGLMARIPTSPL